MYHFVRKNIHNFHTVSLEYMYLVLTSFFVDIEELVYILVEDILEEPHFFQYDNGNQDYVHQILIDSSHETMATYNDETIDVQSCLENSFKHWGDLKLIQCPKPGFFIQLPRSNGDLIRYCGILPNVALNLEEIITVNRGK
jgi:hypothetical protein